MPKAPKSSESTTLRQDVESLLQDSVVEEASSEVELQWQAALSNLDAESLALITQFLEGTSLAEIGEERNLSVKETEAWVSKVKRELIGHLRANCKVKQ